MRGVVPVLIALFVVVASMPFAGATAASPAALGAVAEREQDDLSVVPLDPTADPDETMRSRPFIIDEGAYDAFCYCNPNPRPLSEGRGRQRLRLFLEKRGADEATIAEALARYDDPAVEAIVPAPTLRAALLMLTGWDPYEATIASILDGENATGRPFVGLVYGNIELQEAVATLIDEPRGRFTMVINEQFAGESPEQMIPVIVHESLHGGGTNSQQEELVANILDTIAYAEVVQVDPKVAEAGTDLSLFNNGELVALINSIGRAGPGQVGISGSSLGDVWMGPTLDALDAASISDAILSDDFYASLPRTGSTGQQTFAALIGRFPGSDALGSRPAFGDEALAIIDRGVGTVITPVEAIDLAATLGLDLAGEVTEGPGAAPLPADAAVALESRPFVPRERQLFDPAHALSPAGALDEEHGAAALIIALDRRGVTEPARSQLLRVYVDPAIVERIPDPSLRAATLMLGAWAPWDVTISTVVNGDNPEGTPLTVGFADLPFGQAAARDPDAAAILLSQALQGEPVEVLASYVVEGTLLRNAEPTAGEAVAAALFGTLAYGQLVALSPVAASAGTAGTVARNRDLLALLNSSAWPENGGLSPANATSIGFLSAPAGVPDILPGLYADAESFSDYVTSKPDAPAFAERADATAPPVFKRYLTFAGVEAEPRFDGETLGELDARMGAFLSPNDVLLIADALRLGTAAE